MIKKRDKTFLAKLFGNSEQPAIKLTTEDAAARYNTLNNKSKKLILGITTGRSGMKWLYEVLCSHRGVTGGNERNGIAEAFYRYIKWNNLPIDVSGIYEVTKRDIVHDWENADISVVGSPYFSLGLNDLVNELQPYKIIWGINDPEFTVTSFYNKGWYREENMRGDIHLVNGFQPALENRWKHFFGRPVPAGEFYHTWVCLTRIGKISWFLNTLNQHIYASINKIPKEKVWIFKLADADQNYDYYLQMLRFLSLQRPLSKKNFLAIKADFVKKADNIRKKWSEKEEEEFFRYTSEYREIYNKL